MPSSCSRSAAVGLTAAGIVLRTALAIQGAPIPIVNYGFEADPAANNTFPVLVPAGWSLYDPNSIIDNAFDAVGIINPTGGTFFPAGAPEGTNAALIFLSGDVGAGHVGLTQTLPAALAPGTRYTLRAEVGNIASGIGSPPFDVYGFFDLDGFPGYRVQLLAGGVVVAQDDNSLSASIPEGEFRTSTVVLDVGAAHPQLGQLLSVRVVNLSIPGSPAEPGIEVDFDDIRLDATPIPPTCTGDFNSDGLVNTADLTLLLARFGSVVTPGSVGDLDANGTVNTSDLVLFLARFGSGCP